MDKYKRATGDWKTECDDRGYSIRRQFSGDRLVAWTPSNHPNPAIPFTPIERMVDCCSALRKAGFSTSGREQLYSGVTGEPLDGMAFMGCVQYQRLRHMVVDMELFWCKKERGQFHGI
jgi:hypothetical protein